MKSIPSIIIGSLLITFLLSCKKQEAGLNRKLQVIQVNGNIHDDVDAFKKTLGPLNIIPNVTGGHREINWDGVPDDLLDKPLPGDFFNPTGSNTLAARQRGLLYTGGNFMVSSTGFAAVNSKASTEFEAFSGTKTFANTTNKTWDISFQLPGSTESAFIQAFGIVFSDVDQDSSTSVEFFDGINSLGKYFVPAQDTSSKFSFLAVNFNNDNHISRIAVTHNGFLAEDEEDISKGGHKDFIVLDDFIYSEPVAR